MFCINYSDELLVSSSTVGLTFVALHFWRVCPSCLKTEYTLGRLHVCWVLAPAPDVLNALGEPVGALNVIITHLPTVGAYLLATFSFLPYRVIHFFLGRLVWVPITEGLTTSDLADSGSISTVLFPTIFLEG